MTKHLLLSAATTINWTLPESTDMAALSRRLGEAIRNGDVIVVFVRLKDRPDVDVEMFVNCKNLVTAIVVDLADESGADTQTNDQLRIRSPDILDGL